MLADSAGASGVRVAAVSKSSEALCSPSDDAPAAPDDA